MIQTNILSNVGGFKPTLPENIGSFKFNPLYTLVVGDYMLTFEESREALSQIADRLPPAIFNGLNGGILLLPDTVTDTDDLLILGEYHVEPFGMGRYVTIHYGSMKQAYGHLGPRTFCKKLESVLHHELVHHLEDLAGDRTLEIEDAIELEKLLSSKRKDAMSRRR